jgi:hypothetical protein
LVHQRSQGDRKSALATAFAYEQYLQKYWQPTFVPSNYQVANVRVVPTEHHATKQTSFAEKLTLSRSAMPMINVPSTVMKHLETSKLIQILNTPSNFLLVRRCVLLDLRTLIIGFGTGRVEPSEFPWSVYSRYMGGVMPTVLHQLVWEYMVPVFSQDPNLGVYPAYSEVLPVPKCYLNLTEDIARFIAFNESLQARLIRHHGSKAVKEEEIFKDFAPCFNSTGIFGSEFLNWKSHVVSLLDRSPEYPLMPLAGMFYFTCESEVIIDLEYQPLAKAFSLDDYEMPVPGDSILDDIVDCYLGDDEDVTPDASFDDVELASIELPEENLELVSIELSETRSEFALIEAIEQETFENTASTQVQQIDVVVMKMPKERKKYVAPPTDRVLRSMTRKTSELRRSPRNKTTKKK